MDEAEDRRPVVLCVDDEVPVLSALRRALSREPYDVLVTSEPTQALEWLDDRPVSVVIADQRMPGMSGTELLSAVRRRSPETSRLLISGYPATEEMARRGEPLLPKPWNDELLRTTIRALLQRQEARHIVTLLLRPSLFREPVFSVDCAGRGNEALHDALLDAASDFQGTDVVAVLEHAVLAEEPFAPLVESLEKAGAHRRINFWLHDASGTLAAAIGSSSFRHVQEVGPALLGPRRLDTLVVDPDVERVSFLRNLLMGIGHTCTTAVTPSEVERLLRLSLFDLVIAGPTVPESLFDPVMHLVTFTRLAEGMSFRQLLVILRGLGDEP